MRCSRSLGSWRRLAVLLPLQLLAMLPLTGHAAITMILEKHGDWAGNSFSATSDVIVDSSANVYVVGFISDNVFRITKTGVVKEILDESVLFEPHQLALDPIGNLYVALFGADQVLRLTPGGATSVVLDASGDGSGNPLDGPFGVVADSSGNVYVAGSISDNVFRIAVGVGVGSVTQILDATGDGAGGALDGPARLAVDSAGDVYVSGRLSDNAFRVTSEGAISEIIDATGDGAGNPLDNPQGIAVDASGNVYVSGADSNNAFRITPGGVITEIIDEVGAGGGKDLTYAGSLAVGPAGNVYVLGERSYNAFEIDPLGLITEIIDTTGDGAGNRLYWPYGLAVDGAGNVYVGSIIESKVFKIGEPLPVPTLGLGAQALLAACLATLAAWRISRAGARPQMSGT